MMYDNIVIDSNFGSGEKRNRKPVPVIELEFIPLQTGSPILVSIDSFVFLKQNSRLGYLD